jgi:hypothetical protein
MGVTSEPPKEAAGFILQCRNARGPSLVDVVVAGSYGPSDALSFLNRIGLITQTV